MNDETEPERRTIHVFDIDLETGDVPVRELHIVRECHWALQNPPLVGASNAARV
jgi:hypothetical protein